MADIVQEIGFETSQAVTAITQLNNALKGVNRNLGAFNKKAGVTEAQRLEAALNDMAEKAKKAENNLKGANKTLEDTKDKTQKVTIAFSGLAKALVAREVVQALNRIKTAIWESSEAASEFQLAVARISNIAKGPGSSIAQLTESLSDLSVELGRPAEEVNEAAWEALQNDLGTTRETMDMLGTSAGNLALITGGTLTQAINSLSSVLKAYDLDISEADTVTDIFFAAIDKGRLTLEELESSLGKITPLAARLDLDFANVASAMAAITQQGTSAQVANTQLRNILQKLIKPTEELEAAFHKLGVSTFNELIARSGNLQVALQAISQALGNDDQAIAKAFNQLRGQLGVFNLLANEGKIFTDTLDAVTNSAGTAAKAAEEIRNTDAFAGKVAAEEFNKLMREIGESVLHVKTELMALATDWLPEGQKVADVLGQIVKVAIALGGAAVIGSLVTFSGSLSAALAPLMPFILAGAAGFAIGDLITTAFGSMSKDLDAIAQKVKNTQEEIAKHSEESLERSNQAIKQLLDQRGKAYDDFAAGMVTAFELETQGLKNAASLADTIIKNSVSDFGAGMDTIFDNIKNQIKNVQNDLAQAKDKVGDAKQNLEDFQFDKNHRNSSAAQRFNDELSRAKKTGSDLTKALKEAEQDPAAVGRADKLADRLERQAQAIRNQAEQSDNVYTRREGIAKADRLEELALKAKVKTAEAEVTQLNQVATVTESIYQRQLAISQELQTQLTLLGEQKSLLDENRQFKSPAEIAADEAKMQKTLKRVEKLSGQLSENFFKTFGQEKNVKPLVDNISKAFANAKIDFTNIQQQLQEKIQAPEYQIFVKALFDTTGLPKELAGRIEGAREKGGVNPVAQAEEQRREIAKILAEDTQIRQDIRDKTLDYMTQDTAMEVALRTAIQRAGTNDFEGMKELVDRFELLRQKLASPDLTQEQASQLGSELLNLKAKIEGLVSSNAISENIGMAFDAALQAASKALDNKEMLLNLKPVVPDEYLQTLQNSLGKMGIDPTPFSTVETSLRNSATSAGQGAIGTGSMKTHIANSVGPAHQLATELKAAAAAAAAATKPSLYGGDLPFFASGGSPRGGDRYPAMLAKDEYVVNAQSSRNFFSQLQAMNAGQSPQYREAGGPVTNIGDINVNVTGGAGSESPDRFGKQIASSLRRELRRKTSAL